MRNDVTNNNNKKSEETADNAICHVRCDNGVVRKYQVQTSPQRFKVTSLHQLLNSA